MTQGVAFRSLNPALMRSWRHTGVVRAGLEAYFQRVRASERPAPAGAGWHGEYREYFESHPLRNAALRGLDHLRAAFQGLPAQAQHGDFVANNLGLSSVHRLAIFDWEDYGAVDVPGLDLFTLEISMSDALSAPAALRSTPARDRRRPVGFDIDRMCRALGLPRPLYEQSALAYGFVFRFLKRNYGPEIRERLDQLLEGLSTKRGASHRAGGN